TRRLAGLLEFEPFVQVPVEDLAVEHAVLKHLRDLGQLVGRAGRVRAGHHADKFAGQPLAVRKGLAHRQRHNPGRARPDERHDLSVGEPVGDLREWELIQADGFRDLPHLVALGRPPVALSYRCVSRPRAAPLSPDCHELRTSGRYRRAAERYRTNNGQIKGRAWRHRQSSGNATHPSLDTGLGAILAAREAVWTHSLHWFSWLKSSSEL